MTLTLFDSHLQKIAWPGQLEIDSPSSIHVLGEVSVFDLPRVAIVGTRRCSPYGQMQAERFSRELSQQGFSIVSGLAYGVDKAAHEACINAKGQTIAVVAQGLDKIQPRGNLNMVQSIIENRGCVLSEKPLGYSGPKYEYLRRNRLISGLSLGVVIVEAAFKSGALNTAKHALEQGKEVMVIPGRLTDPKSQGCLKLIQQGAHLVTHPRDVVEILGYKWKKPEEIHGLQQLKGLEAELYRELSKKAAHLSELSEHFRQQENQVYQALIHLELEGWIVQGLDRRYRVLG